MISAKRAIAAILILSLPGCSLVQPVQPNQAGRIADQKLDRHDEELLVQPQLNQDIRRNLDEPVMSSPAREGAGLVGEIDVGSVLKPSPDNAAAGAKNREKPVPVRLEFTDANLRDVVVVFLRDYLKQPYVFQDSFKDRKVNLFFDARATRGELIELFDNLLSNYGARLRYGGGTYLVGADDDKSGALQQPSPLGIGDAVGVFRPQFVDARDLQVLAKQVTKYPDKITVLPGNILVTNSSSTDLRAVRNLLEDIDVSAFGGKHILIYAPRHLSAGSLIALLDSTHAGLAGAQAGNKQFETKQIPDTERIVIVAANGPARELVLQLLAQSDVPGANQRRVFQYPLGSQAAADIVTNLTTMIKSVIKSPGEVSLVADKPSNSLFIYASPEEYAEIRKLLQRMDFRPPEVQIDMVIAEVKLTSSMQYGVDWYLKRVGHLITDIGTNFSAGLKAGLTAGIVDTHNNYATLQLIGSETTFSLLSNPKIMVKNGSTAKIVVGSEEPVIKSKTINSASAGGNTVVEPEFKNIGLEMEVTPFVAANNEVRMVIKLKDTAITGSKKLNADDYPILAKRELNTEFVAADGSTVFLGGIRRQDATDSSNKLPWFADLKGIGALFRDKNMQGSGSELIILATPTVILDQQGADAVTRALMRAAREEFKGVRAADVAPEQQQALPQAPASAP